MSIDSSVSIEPVEQVPSLFGVWTLRHGLRGVLPWRASDLRDLAGQLPMGWLQAYDADGADLPSDLSPSEALDRLDSVSGVVRFLHIELVPKYREVMQRVCRSMATIATPGEAMTRHTGVVYVANQGSGARLHVDQHPNFFVHLAGHKSFTVAGCSSLRQHHALVAALAGGRRDHAIEPDVVRTFDLGPGDALYLPPFTIHAVETAEGRSVSVACSWSTPSSEHAVRMQWANRQLRRVGLRTTWSHRRRRGDAAKLGLARVVSRLR